MFKKGNHWKVLVSIENHPLRSPSVCQAVRSIVWSPLACSHEIYAYDPNNHETRNGAKGEGDFRRKLLPPQAIRLHNHERGLR